MKASFFEYNVAMSGIFTARANLNVVGHNMANGGIPGYSRQQSIQRASRPLTLYDGKGMYGTGSEVLGVKQIRDFYLDKKYWQHSNVFGEYNAKNTNLEMLETVFSDLSDSGILTCFEDYFGTLQDLSTTTPDQTYRANVINAAETLTDMIQTNAEALHKQQRDINSEVENTITIINSLGVQIADLNEQIKSYERDGSMANDLRDQRARLVDQLSEFVNIDVQEDDYSTEDMPYDLRYTVMVNGYPLVQEENVNPLMVVARNSQGTALNGKVIQGKDKQNEMDAPGLFDIYFANTGTEFNINSITLKGTLKGLIDVRDGNGGILTEPKNSDNKFSTTLYKGIPYYMNKLNTLVRTFARSMNEGLDHKLGNIPKDTNGNIVGHMYAYNYYKENTGSLLFSSLNGIDTGSNPDGLGELNMWECTYTLNGVEYTETLTTKHDPAVPNPAFNANDLLDLPDGAVLSTNPAEAPERLYVWESVYTVDGKTVRNVVVAPKGTTPPDNGPAAPNGDLNATSTMLSDTTVDYSNLNVFNFTVNPDLTESGGSFLLACASDPTQGESANDVILGFGKIGEYNSLFREGKLLDYIIGTTNHLAIDKMQSDKFEVNYTEIKMMTDNQRISVSGVDFNEEIGNMIRYNQQFTACAKLVNTINQIYDTLINRLGV